MTELPPSKPREEFPLKPPRIPGALVLSTALVAALAAIVIIGTAPSEAVTASAAVISPATSR